MSDLRKQHKNNRKKKIHCTFFIKDSLFQENYFMTTTNANSDFCNNLRLFCQYWEKKNGDEIVGICRKNLLKLAKLRKKDVYKCISGKLDKKSIL